MNKQDERCITECRLKEISKLLKELGAPAHLSGYQYVKLAIEFCKRNQRFSMTKDVYPYVAQEFETSPSRVERSIRHLINVTFERADPGICFKYFGNSINSKKGRPTNSEFIYTICEYI